MSTETKKQRFVRTLREVADYVESRPFTEDGHYFSTDHFYLSCHSANEFGKNVAAAGRVEKRVGEFSEELEAIAKIGMATFMIFVNQSLVCKRVKVGDKVIEAKPEHVLAAEPERIEEVYEYQCPKSFVSLKDRQTAEEVEEVRV